MLKYSLESQIIVKFLKSLLIKSLEFNKIFWIVIICIIERQLEHFFKVPNHSLVVNRSTHKNSPKNDRKNSTYQQQSLQNVAATSGKTFEQGNIFYLFF